MTHPTALAFVIALSNRLRDVNSTPLKWSIPYPEWQVDDEDDNGEDYAKRREVWAAALIDPADMTTARNWVVALQEIAADARVATDVAIRTHDWAATEPHWFPYWSGEANKDDVQAAIAAATTPADLLQVARTLDRAISAHMVLLHAVKVWTCTKA